MRCEREECRPRPAAIGPGDRDIVGLESHHHLGPHGSAGTAQFHRHSYDIVNESVDLDDGNECAGAERTGILSPHHLGRAPAQ